MSLGYIYITPAYLHLGYGVTANIAASHAAARGSIPRIRMVFIVSGLRINLLDLISNNNV